MVGRIKVCKGMGKQGTAIHKGMNSKPATAMCPVCHTRRNCTPGGKMQQHYVR
jgi:hypothetical protein